ncbi:MAG: hypothetical protein GXY36_16845 [Chloroflexi bacterium]|nr:hypothetical protein [Chloroflexota bacterium]
MQTTTQTGYELYENSTFERPRYFPGQMITHEDLTLGMRYAQEQMRLHNRLLHGWGVVCGCEVRPCSTADEQGWHIRIGRGYVLDALGNMICIHRDIVLDIRGDEVAGCGLGPNGEAIDPWCSDVKIERRAGQTLYIAVRYYPYAARPVRAQPGGCGCDDSDCEYSREYDSFIVRPLSRLPGNYDEVMTPPGWDDMFDCDLMAERACPPYPSDPWVILADVTPDADGSLTISYAHRRIVVSLAELYLICQAPDEAQTPEEDRTILLDRAARAGLEEMIDAAEFNRLEAEYAAELHRAVDLPAVTLRSVGTGSALGRQLTERKLTIGALAEVEDLDTLIEAMAAEVSPQQAADIRRRLPEIHRRAQNVREISQAIRS